MCAGRQPRIKIFFFLLSTFVDELITTPKIITFLQVPLFRALLVFYAMLARELPYAILAQTMQC